MDNIRKEQFDICHKYGFEPFEYDEILRIGISDNLLTKETIFPINGLRHNPEGNTSGWYIWGGEGYSEEDDFFKPLHIFHLKKYRPELLKYLSLPPGTRFLLGENDYVDVWFDENLINL